MVELLVKMISVTHPDSEKDKRGCYKRGDVVEVRRAGANYGKEECLPKFIVVRLTDISYEDALELTKPETQDVFDPINPQQFLRHETLTRRRYKFDIDKNMTAKDIEDVEKADWLVKEYSQVTVEDKVG